MNQNKALGIAYKAHIGQLDKGGSVYIASSQSCFTLSNRG